MAKKLYEDPKGLEKAINKYFAQWDDPEYKKPMTYSGLAYALGFAYRQSLNQYAALDDERYSLPIKRAMLRIDTDYEERLASGSPTGAIFALKNRGWKDRQEIEHTVNKEVYESLKKTYGV